MDLSRIQDLKLKLVDMDTGDIEFRDLPKSLADLQRVERSFNDKGLNVDFFYEDFKGNDMDIKDIKNYDQFKESLQYVSGQGIMILYRKKLVGDEKSNVWGCKICMSKNTQSDTFCKVCERPRPAVPGNAKILA